MDHLGEDVESRFDKVPCCITEDIKYDYKGFHEFPDRAKWGRADDGQWKQRGTAQGRSEAEGLGNFEAFLQAWLFFGLLSEVLGPAVRIQDRHFIEETNLGHGYITTSKLGGYLQKWKQYELNNETGRHGRLVRAELALNEAHTLVSEYCSVTKADESPVWKIRGILALSFMVLGETLAHAKADILQELGLTVHGWTSSSLGGWGDSKAVLQKMEENKWCPYSVHKLQGLLRRSTTGFLYAFRISYPGLALTHKDCSIEVCEARESLRTKGVHGTDHNCKCVQIGPKMSEVVDIIQRNRIPLFVYSEGSGIDVVEHKDNMRYMIISHVWTDGFSNSEDNKISECLLRQFIDLFRRLKRADQAYLAGSPTGQPVTDIRFWIDTLAIPVRREYANERLQAIANMNNVYVQAAATVVLDAGLMAQNTGIDYIQQAMKITTSHWMTRLWTLQEAFLSKRLLFAFADVLVDLNTLESSPRTSPIPGIHVAAGSYYRAILGPERASRLNKNTKPSDSTSSMSIDPQLIASMWEAVQWRKTHHPQHETVVLATMLNLTLRPTQDDLDQRMKQFLKSITAKSECAIPAEFIFLPGPYLTLEGFGWAPKSWMTGQGLGKMAAFSFPPAGAQPTEQGLEVRFPGFKLHSMDPTGRDIHEAGEMVFASDISLSQWLETRNDEADFIGPPQWNKGLAIITRENVRATWQVALLVAIQEVRNQTLCVQRVRLISIRIDTNYKRADDLRRDFKGPKSKAIFGELLAPNQLWRVDGPKRDSELASIDSSSSRPSLFGRFSTFFDNDGISRKSK